MDVCMPSRQKMGTGQICWDEMPVYDSFSKREVKVYSNDDKWTVKLSIPWKGFGLQQAPAEGTTWQFAVCRYNYSSAVPEPELSSTAHFNTENSHQYENYHNLNF